MVLSACRLDVVVDVVMQPDGSGTVTVDATADAELVAQVPDLVDDLRLEDAAAAGWVVTGPTAVEGGGLVLRLTHDFRTAEDLASLLNSIGPPLVDMQVARTTAVDEDGTQGATTNAIDGTLALANGFQSFADSDLVQAVGGQPFGDELTASGLTPDQAMSFTLRVALPGELESSETGTEIGDGVIEWRARLDGTPTALLTTTVQTAPGSGNSWARPLATAAWIMLVVWVALAAVLIGFVAVARRSRRRRRKRALRHLDR
jgi:hypothetical protein